MFTLSSAFLRRVYGRTSFNISDYFSPELTVSVFDSPLDQPSMLYFFHLFQVLCLVFQFIITTKIAGSSSMFIFICSRYCHIVHQSVWKFPASPEYVRAPIYPHPRILIIVILSVCVCVCVCVQSFSHVPLFATSWTIAHQTPLSMEFSRQEYWSGLPFPTPGDLPGPGVELASKALAGGFFTI